MLGMADFFLLLLDPRVRFLTLFCESCAGCGTLDRQKEGSKRKRWSRFGHWCLYGRWGEGALSVHLYAAPARCRWVCSCV